MTREYKKVAYGESLRMANEGIVHPVLTCVRLTRNCNLKCDYCSEVYVPTGQDLKFEEWKRVTDIVYHLGNRDVVLSGGEPLLKKYLVDLVSHAASRDAFVSIATNGLLLSREHLIAFDDAGLDYLCISVDTLDSKGGSQFGKTLDDKMRAVLEGISGSNYNFETQISTVVTAHNLSDLPEMVAYFSSLGMPTKLMIMMRNEINRQATEHLSLEQRQTEVQRTTETLLAMKDSGALLIDDDFTLSRLDQFFRGQFTYNCNGGEFDLSINNDGRLVVCPDGIISSRSLFEIVSLEQYHEFIKQSKAFTAKCPGCLWSYKQRLEEAVTQARPQG